MRVIVVSAADEAYAAPLRDLLRSVRRFRPLDPLELGVLDLGLAPRTQAELAAQGVAVVEPGWDLDLGEDRQRRSPHLRAMTARPWLPRYFPGRDIVVWLDADLWVQDPAALLLYVRGAEESGFAVAPELDRSYRTVQGPSRVGDFHRSVYRDCFGPGLAETMLRYAVVNSGALAGRAASPVWDLWARTHAAVAARMPDYAPHAEQAALNAAVWTLWPEGIALLPATCNWICSLAPPLWDRRRRVLVEPHLPHAAIGLVHLAGLTAPRSLGVVGGGSVYTDLSLGGIESLHAEPGRGPSRQQRSDVRNP